MKIYIITALMVISYLLGIMTYHLVHKPKTITITQEKIVYKTITKNVDTMPVDELKKELQCYYTAKPMLDITMIQESPIIIKAEAGLCQRKWERNATIQIKEDSNYIYYIGIAGIAGIATYLLTK